MKMKQSSMRSTPAKQEIKLIKPVSKKLPVTKRRKIWNLSPPTRDTISETISFVIQGKLTPIKPILLGQKIDLTGKNRAVKNPKVLKKINQKPSKVKKIKEQDLKTKSKVQTKTAKKISAQTSCKKKTDKVVVNLVTESPKENLKNDSKIVKKKPKTKEEKPKKNKNTVKEKTIKPPKKISSKIGKSSIEATTIIDEDELKKQQTIEKLLKEVNEEMSSKKCKHKSSKSKKKKESDKIALEKLADPIEDPLLQKTIKSELIETPDVSTVEDKKDVKPITNTIVDIKDIKTEPESKIEQKSPSKKKYVKLKTKPKVTVMKKRVPIKDKNKVDKRKTKLFKFWNGPKRHRVASLNALAKVHCLYENETRGNILDIIDESAKMAYMNRAKNKSNKTEIPLVVKDEDLSNSSSGSRSPPPTRILRSVPGLRGAGKHWELDDASSSDDEFHKLTAYPLKVVKVKKERLPQPKPKPKEEIPPAPPTERKRKSNETVMDLKDMVVRKRMASLNASAILAASYSVEKRPNKSKDSIDDSSSCSSNSSDEYFAAIDQDINIKEEEVDKKDDDTKLIEVHSTPNKKVAVILNQDTDVTITGVYVNSTTRSTHHEGYCSIAGMQYRISATSHTQTAATAVATETLLQSSSSTAGSGPDISNSDSMPSSKSYTPLDALSNMQPPPGPGIQHNHPVLHGQQHMGPPQHVLPLPPHQMSPGIRHGCPSAFSSPSNSNSGYQIPPGHHPPLAGESGYVHAGYYQPAGPLITVPPPHSHGQPPPPPVPPLNKTVPLSETSPTSSTTPSLTSHEVPPPPPSSNGDSSDSEVIITSVTAAKDTVPPTYRYSQYPGYPYQYSHPYYPTPPPPPNPSYAHHDLCYSPPYGHKWTFRRHLAGAQYYPVPNPPELYPIPPPPGPSQQSQQMVTATPVSASGTYSTPPGGPPPPPPTIMETFAGPQPTLVETYQPPPPPPHYYPSPPYGAPCYSHPPRTIPYINTYQSSCPCPMQSCPKNVLTGPLTGDSKRSNNLSSISKEPLPSIALALPLEPASATGPPSPARGSAGMPPPPSPAGATYQPPPVLPTKQESQSPTSISEGDCKFEKKRKARIGKAMVRNNIAANMQNNTMLLMCNPSQNFVKREIESPKEIELGPKRDLSDEEVTPRANEGTQKRDESKDCVILESVPQINLTVEPKEEKITEPPQELENRAPLKEEIEEDLPIIHTVAENVKVKNMKRKLSMCTEKTSEPEVTPLKKKQKTGSYKFLIKKETNAVKINNGKRKLLSEMSPAAKAKRAKIRLRKSNNKKKLTNSKVLTNNHRKLSLKGRALYESKEKNSVSKKVNLRNSKTAPAALDKLFAKNNVERIIESVICDSYLRTPQGKCAKQPKDSSTRKTANKVVVPNAKNIKKETKKVGTTRRKSKCNEISTTTQVVKSIRRSLATPKWSNGWIWEGEPFEAKVFLNSDELIVVRKCYPAMRHHSGDKIVPRDCVLLKAGPRKNDLPFVAKIAALWENPDDGEMMMSLLWYYRPEHTEQGRLPTDQSDEVFASRHKDSNSVACIDDKCYVLTFNEYCRYRKTTKRLQAGIEEALPCIPNPEPYPRSHRQPPMTLISPEMVFFCRRVYDFRQKRIMKNPT